VTGSVPWTRTAFADAVTGETGRSAEISALKPFLARSVAAPTITTTKTDHATRRAGDVVIRER
jgi:hypothetical protein